MLCNSTIHGASIDLCNTIVSVSDALRFWRHIDLHPESAFGVSESHCDNKLVIAILFLSLKILQEYLWSSVEAYLVDYYRRVTEIRIWLIGCNFDAEAIHQSESINTKTQKLKVNSV
jgi:hypothetical protein